MMSKSLPYTFKRTALPLAVLICSFLIRLFFSGEWSMPLSYDEIIVTTISRQPLPLLWHTIQAEPHPFGFYIILKLFPTNANRLLRISLQLLLIGMLGVSTLVLSKRTIYQSFKLQYALALLFGSFGFIDTLVLVKQTALSLALFVPYLIIGLDYVQAAGRKKSDFWLLNLMSLLFLLVDYRYYLISLVFLLLLHFIKKNMKSLYLSTAIQSIAIIFMGGLLTFNQILNNALRFGWIKYYKNSVIEVFSFLFLGSGSTNIFTDAWLFVSFSLIFGGAYLLYKQAKTKDISAISVIVLVIILFALMAYTRSFTQLRYAMPFFTLIVISTVGLSIAKLLEIAKTVKPFYLLPIALLPTFFYLKTVHEDPSFSRRELLYSLDSDKIYGYLEDHPNRAKVVLLNHQDITNVIPLNVLSAKRISEEDTITQQDLMIESGFKELETNEVKSHLLSAGLDNYIYVMGGDSSWDKSKKVLRILLQHCRTEDFKVLSEVHLLYAYTFTDCRF